MSAIFIEKLSLQAARVYKMMAWLGCSLLLAMLLVICGDVIARNAFRSSIPWSNEVSEYALYLMTLLAAPWLLHAGQHIRVDIFLRALPSKLAWLCEWLVDISGMLCSLVLAWYGLASISDSIQTNAVTMKTIQMPEWWVLVPFPVVFAVMAIEFGFRMFRLHAGPRQPREEAVSAA